MKTLIGTITVATMLSCISCNSGPSGPSQATSFPVSTYQLPDQITLTASAVRDASGGTVIEGTTNLPDGTKLGVELMNGTRTAAQDFSVFVASGVFHSAGFRIVGPSVNIPIQ